MVVELCLDFLEMILSSEALGIMHQRLVEFIQFGLNSVTCLLSATTYSTSQI